jgi:hypothetical protein
MLIRARPAGAFSAPHAPTCAGSCRRRRDGAAQREPPGGLTMSPDPPWGDRGAGSARSCTGLRAGPQAAGDALDRRAVRDSPQFIAVLDERRVPPSVPAGHSRVRTGSWPTRRTPRQPTAPTCVAGASGRRSRSRPTRPPPGVVGLQRRPSAGLRRDPLQAAPRRRVPHQPAQTQPGSSQPIRETRRPLPRRHPHRRHQRMATQALMKHGLGG